MGMESRVGYSGRKQRWKHKFGNYKPNSFILSLLSLSHLRFSFASFSFVFSFISFIYHTLSSWGLRERYDQTEEEQLSWHSNQWLRLHLPSSGGHGFDPGRRNNPTWCGPKNKKAFKKKKNIKKKKKLSKVGAP